jgi:hypothetical protein
MSEWALVALGTALLPFFSAGLLLLFPRDPVFMFVMLVFGNPAVSGIAVIVSMIATAEIRKGKQMRGRALAFVAGLLGVAYYFWFQMESLRR